MDFTLDHLGGTAILSQAHAGDMPDMHGGLFFADAGNAVYQDWLNPDVLDSDPVADGRTYEITHAPAYTPDVASAVHHQMYPDVTLQPWPPAYFDLAAQSGSGTPYTDMASSIGSAATPSTCASDISVPERLATPNTPPMQHIHQSVIGNDASAPALDSRGERRLDQSRKELYDRVADTYYCPLGGLNGELCDKKHKPTSQRCKYVRNLDSHFLPFWCDECERPFSSKNVYSRHVREQHLNNKTHCPVEGCSRAQGFSRERNMHDHMRRTHGIEPSIGAGAAGDTGAAGKNSPLLSPARVQKSRSPKARRPASRKGQKPDGSSKL